MIYIFEDQELDTRLFELRRGGTSYRLEPQVFDVLVYLIRHRDRVVTKDELFDQVWHDRIVTESALNNRIMAARRSIGDSGRAQRFIMTVHGRGFRFVAPVEERSTDTSHAEVVARRSGTYDGSGIAHEPVLPGTYSSETAAPIPMHEYQLSYGNTGSRPLMAVGREAELERLHDWLEGVLASGKRQVVFVTGETGAGKTTIVDLFLHQAGERVRLWIGEGQCLEYRGVGEPYMPILEAFWRICRGMGGKAVINTLAQFAPTWLVQMPGLVSKEELEDLKHRIVGSSRERMIREMVEAVEILTAERPMILVLEDLHWSDYSTLGLVARLAQRKESARLLFLGTYRPGDALREGHPLYVLQHQLELHGQCAELPVGRLDVGAVEAYLAARFPGADFTHELAPLVNERTDGNPLFMIRLVDYWISEGMLTRVKGRWMIPQIISEIVQGVPESLKQLVEQDLGLLPLEDQTVLEAASLVGMEFSAAAVAAALELSEEDVEERCANLARRRQFLYAGGIANCFDGTVSTRFQFVHSMYQEVLYGRVPPGRRSRLHRRIGNRLETCYGSHVREQAVELAVHFVRAHDVPRAVQYLRWAAEQALMRSAHMEAIEHLRTARDMLFHLPDTPERRETELAIQSTLGSTLVKMHGWASPEAEQAFIRARELSEQLNGHPQLIPTLYELAVLYEFRGAYDASQELMNHRLGLSQDSFLPEAHELLACSTFYQGRFSRSLEHARHGITVYEVNRDDTAPGFWGHNSGILCHDWAALALWFLGYPDQARREGAHALSLARAPEAAHSLGNVQMKTAIFHQCLLDAAKTAYHAEVTVSLARNDGFAYRIGAGMILGGWARTVQGSYGEGLARMREGLEIHRTTGANMDRPYFLGLLADACARSDCIDEGRRALEEALALVARGRTFFFEAELHRISGMLRLHTRTERGRAEMDFLRALEVARRQQANLLEIRAATSLASLWHEHGKLKPARELLEPIFSRFTEGFDTHDLTTAAVLLNILTERTSVVS